MEQEVEERGRGQEEEGVGRGGRVSKGEGGKDRELEGDPKRKEGNRNMEGRRRAEASGLGQASRRNAGRKVAGYISIL